MLRESGYTVKGACEALGISRSSYYVSLKELERLDPWRGLNLLRQIIPFGVIVGLRHGLVTEKGSG